jgi:hypothetical protein
MQVAARRPRLAAGWLEETLRPLQQTNSVEVTRRFQV